jgi:hypothetical protein
MEEILLPDEMLEGDGGDGRVSLALSLIFLSAWDAWNKLEPKGIVFKSVFSLC